MDDQLRDKLWDLVYGLLEQAEADELRARITSDREVAKAYARVKLESELLAQAAKGNRVAADWTIESAALVSSDEPRRGRRFWRSTVAVASLALSLLLLVYAGLKYASPESPLAEPMLAQQVDRLLAEHPRLLVLGPAELERGVSSQCEVLVEDLQGKPLAAEVEAKLVDALGQIAWREKTVTEAGGTHWFKLPESLSEPKYQLAIDLKHPSTGLLSTADEPELTTWLAMNDTTQGDALLVDEVVTTEGERFLRTLSLNQREEKFAEADLKLMRDFDGSAVTLPASLEQEVNRVRWGLLFSEVPLLAGQDTDSYSYRSEFSDHSYYFDPSPQRARFVEDSPGPLNRPTTKYAPVVPGGIAGDQPARPEERVKPEGPVVARLEPAERIPADPIPIELKLERAAKETAETLSAEKGRYVIEAFFANGSLISNRLVNADRANADTLRLRLQDVRSEGLVASDFVGTLRGAYYDYTTAPPTALSEVSQTVELRLESLHLSLTCDREFYRPGDPAVVEISCTQNGQPVGAVLDVRLESQPAGQVPAEETGPAPYFVSLPQAKSPALPLVFDNAPTAQQDLLRSLDALNTTREVARQEIAIFLLFGSGFGYAMLLVAALFKVLPSIRIWMPSALMLAVTSSIAVFWMAAGENIPPPAITVTNLTTYGVNESSPPPRGEALQIAETNDPVNLGSANYGFSKPESDYVVTNGTLFMADQLNELVTLRSLDEQPLNRFDLAFRAARLREIETLNDDSVAEKKRGIDSFIVPQSPFPHGQPGALSWQPILPTDAAGKARIDFDIPDECQTYTLRVKAHAGQTVGQEILVLPCIWPSTSIE